MTTETRVVVGNSIASAVAVRALAIAGEPVTWFRTSRSLLGGFAPIVVDGTPLELGMRLVELSYDVDATPAPDLHDYTPGPHGHRPFLSLVEGLIRELAGGDLREVRSGEVIFEERHGADMIVAGDLIDVPWLLGEDQTRIVCEEASLALSRLGPRGLFDDPDTLGRTSYEEASIAHCGAAFHRTLIEPLLDAIVPDASDKLIASMHRKFWLPLFHPRTVAESASSTLSYRPNRPLFTLEPGGMGLLIARLESYIKADEFVKIVEIGRIERIWQDGTTLHLQDDRGVAMQAVSPIVGLAPDELFAAVGSPVTMERATANIAWVTAGVDRERPSVSWTIGSDTPAFRVSHSNAGSIHDARERWTVELDASLPKGELEQAAMDSMSSLGYTDSDSRVVTAASVPSFTLPTFDNRELFTEAKTALDAQRLSMQLVGGAVAFGVDSFNEQVVQGLRAAAMAGSVAGQR